jgi:hypothetical protein
MVSSVTFVVSGFFLQQTNSASSSKILEGLKYVFLDNFVVLNLFVSDFMLMYKPFL